jgi:hypothetical protein
MRGIAGTRKLLRVPDQHNTLCGLRDCQNVSKRDLTGFVYKEDIYRIRELLT